MNSRFAETIVTAIVLVWLGSVVVAVVDPDRGATAAQLSPIMGTIAGGAIAALAISRKKNGNGPK